MTLRGWADLYAWQLDRASRTPLTRQIYMQVRGAVLFGALRPGSRMPSSRAMASKLGVARASGVRHSAIVWAKMVARRRFFDPRHIKRR
jgi:DNA-binding transcriptional MocR family regulator